MKQRKCLFTNALTLLAASALLTTSCIDNEKNYFDSDKVKDLYESSFPVQNIDPNMDWKTTQNISAVVAVNEDYGVNYKIRIYDANPLIEGSNAKLLTEGYANQDLKFTTSFDCPASTSMVYVARTDEKNRTVVQPILVDANGINVNFGATAVSTRSGEADPVRVAYTMSAPYTESEIQDMLAKATEIQQGWDVGAESSWDGNYSDYPVFSLSESEIRYFKSSNEMINPLSFGGSKSCIIIVDSKLTFTNKTTASSKSIEFIITANGELNIQNEEFQCANATNIVVMPGGKISGNGKLTATNASGGKINYNGGTITVSNLEINGTSGYLYNAGTVNIDVLNITNDNTHFVNNSIANIHSVSNSNSSVINLCYFTAVEFSGHLILANNCGATITNYNATGWGRKLDLGSNSLVTISNNAGFSGTIIKGANAGESSLIKIKNFKSNNNASVSGNVYFEIENYNATLPWGAQIANSGDAPVVIPSDLCTGTGNTPSEEGKPLPSDFIEYTYAYEDNFPSVGDYDFNDVVMDVKTTYNRLTTNNNIQSATINVTLKAVGGIKNSGAAIRLVGINKSDIASIAFSGDVNMRNTLTNSMFQNADMEDGNEVIIPLFGDSHGVFGRSEDRPMINTGFGQTLDTHTLDITLTPSNQNSPTPFIGKDNMDIFIAYAPTKNGRTEVHLYEFSSQYGLTSKAFDHSENLDIAGNKTWAIVAPNFKFPKENASIIKAYPTFEAWAQDRNTNVDWHTNPNESLIIK